MGRRPRSASSGSSSRRLSNGPRLSPGIEHAGDQAGVESRSGAAGRDAESSPEAELAHRQLKRRWNRRWVFCFRERSRFHRNQGFAPGVEARLPRRKRQVKIPEELEEPDSARGCLEIDSCPAGSLEGPPEEERQRYELGCGGLLERLDKLDAKSFQAGRGRQAAQSRGPTRRAAHRVRRGNHRWRDGGGAPREACRSEARASSSREMRPRPYR
jgi:hypothetical protein